MQDCKVNILGTEYKIHFEKFGDKGVDGYTDPASFEIVLRNDNDNEVGDFDELQRKQLRHEVIHAFMNESGLQCNCQHTQQSGVISILTSIAGIPEIPAEESKNSEGE